MINDSPLDNRASTQIATEGDSLNSQLENSNTSTKREQVCSNGRHFFQIHSLARAACLYFNGLLIDSPETEMLTNHRMGAG